MAYTFIETTAVGRLGNDPEVKTTGNGKTVAEFSVACDVGFGDNKKTEWLNCVAWEKAGEIIGQYARKGGRMFVKGTPQTDSWEDKNGEKRHKTRLIVREFIILDSEGGASEERQSPARPASAGRRNAPQAIESDDDIPF